MTLFYPMPNCFGNIPRMEYNCRANSGSHICNKGIDCQQRCLTNFSLSLDDISKKNVSSSTATTKGMTRKNDDFTSSTRGILKKSVSADSKSIQKLQESMLLCRSAKSTSNLSTDLSSVDASRISPPPSSPQKNVTFADDNNLSLVEVRNFAPSYDRLNTWVSSPSSYSSIFQQWSASYLDKKTTSCKSNTKVRKPVELLLCFNEPFSGRDFQERFERQYVALQTCSTRGRTVSGIVLVKNIEFEKHVSVRYTLNRWETSTDTTANYVPNSNDGQTDRFAFSLTLPKDCKEMEFALRYKTSSTIEHWDNNQNRNYKVKDSASI